MTSSGGGGGGGADPVITTLAEGQIPQADAQSKLVPSGVRVNQGNGQAVFDKKASFPAGSIDLGPVVTQSEGAKQLVVSNNVDDTIWQSSFLKNFTKP